MLALAIQCLVVQPHIDGVTGAPAVTSAHVAVAPSAPGETDQGQGACVICQAMAVAGSLTLAAAPTIVRHALTFLDAPPAYHADLLQRTRSHSWQSRGPPLFN
jgi:hypothetical protein